MREKYFNIFINKKQLILLCLYRKGEKIKYSQLYCHEILSDLY